MRRAAAAAPALLVFALDAAGCGGSSANDDNLRTVTVQLGAQGSIEGTIDASGAIALASGGLIVGDLEGSPNPGPVRAFLSFDISTLPANATLTSARLKLWQAAVAGSPYATLGNVMVDQVNYSTFFPVPGVYNAALVLGNISTLSATPVLELKSANVLLAVNNDRQALRPRSQFRLRFTGVDQNNDGLDTYARFVDAEGTGGIGPVPVLEIVYTIPN